eukprot:Blabericola_migrator_1__3822@NODE_2151_length_3198_cov_332_916959_g1360_i0_p1_GENE_NODE_2151_length_3198_cov_332_916959_g1360_i0NODE_2151_length_3198_cov_332_916959_g1360_i0_p1_ORF_typecomplete_len116_score9_34_NODE_2151_length_3198_cov_332_916959_g1360_i020082355
MGRDSAGQRTEQVYMPQGKTDPTRRRKGHIKLSDTKATKDKGQSVSKNHGSSRGTAIEAQAFDSMLEMRDQFGPSIKVWKPMVLYRDRSRRHSAQDVESSQLGLSSPVQPWSQCR